MIPILLACLFTLLAACALPLVEDRRPFLTELLAIATLTGVMLIIVLSLAAAGVAT